ncbi:MAG: hypothetical protein QNJ61_06025 [Desulfobacterales bacterium]|nr:hypothetical protein [Desulfobacterales bacterium]
MKSILIDASSAILLYKSGWLETTVAHYHLRTGSAAYRELAVPGYPGADSFQRITAQGRLEVLPTSANLAEDHNLASLGAGERECIQHFLAGAGHFILMDDGRGAAYCRDHGIPYVNALLMPRILVRADPEIGRLNVPRAMAQIFRLGRYAPWILDFARHCSDEALAPFRP